MKKVKRSLGKFLKKLTRKESVYVPKKFYRPKYKFVSFTVLIVFTVIACVYIFDLNRYWWLEQKRSDLFGQLMQAKSENFICEQENNDNQLKLAIYEESQESFRKLIDELTQEKFQLKEEVYFYRKLMNSDIKKKTVYVEKIDIHKKVDYENSRLFELDLYMMQSLAKNQKNKVGHIALYILGIDDNNKKKSYFFQDFTKNDRSRIPFRFKFFQIIKLDLNIPNNITPIGVEVQIFPKKQKKLTQQFEWTLNKD